GRAVLILSIARARTNALGVSARQDPSFSALPGFDHLPGHLHQLVGRAQGSLTHFAKHLRKLEQARLAIEALDLRHCAITLNPLLHLVVLIAKGCKLWKMGHTEDLMRAREIPQLLSHNHADTP